MGGYFHRIEIGECGLGFLSYLLSLFFSGSKSAFHVYCLFISLQSPHFFPPMKGRHKGCLDTNIENRSYEAQMISDIREKRPKS